MKKSIMIRGKSEGDIIKSFSLSYPSHLSGIINEEKYKNIISTLNGFYSHYNYKPLVFCIGLFILGAACIAIGGVSSILLKPKQSESSNNYEIDTNPSIALYIMQILLFSVGAIFLINSFVLLFYITKKPTSNLKNIRDALEIFNNEYLSKQITFSLELDDNFYYLRLIFPSIIPLSEFKEDSPLISNQKVGGYNSMLSNNNIKNSNNNLIIYDPDHSDNDNYYQSSSSNTNNNNNNNNNETESSSSTSD